MKDSIIKFENERIDSGSSNRGTSFMSKSAAKARTISLTPSPHKAHQYYYPDIDLFDNFLVNCQTETIKLEKHGKTENTNPFSLDSSDSLSEQMPNFVKNYDDLVSLVKTKSEDLPRKILTSTSFRASILRTSSDIDCTKKDRNSLSTYSTRDDEAGSELPNFKRSQEILLHDESKRSLPMKSRTVKGKNRK